MAVDTRNKRASCLGFGFPPRVVWPNPDGSLTEWTARQQELYTYLGVMVLIVNTWMIDIFMDVEQTIHADLDRF